MHRITLLGTANGLYELGADGPVEFEGQEINSLAGNGATWWANVDHHELWRQDSGSVWRRVAAIESVTANCLLPVASGLWVGGSETRLFELRGEALEPVRSFDHTEGREDWYTPWGGPPDVRSMTSDPTGTIYVNVHVGGVARSSDGGLTWEPTIDIDADVHQVFFDHASGLLLAASAMGLAVSADRGRSWGFHSQGLHATYARAVAVAGNTVLVTASDGPYPGRAGVYRGSLLSIDSLERCREGLPEWFSQNIDTHCLAAADVLAVFGTPDGQVFCSQDGGESWQLMLGNLPSIRCVALGTSTA